MAIPPSDCGVDGSVCCDTFWLIGERIRDVACTGLTSCLVDDCGEFESYQTEGDIITDPVGESLIVSFLRASVRPDSTRPTGAVSPVFVTRATFRVQLLENGWPHVTGGAEITPPARAEICAAARHARGHAEAMWRAVVGAAATTDQTKALFPRASNPHVMSRGVTVGDLAPMPRPGPQIGYQMDVSVDTKLS